MRKMKETRITDTPLKIRSLEDNKTEIIEGYALKFNQLSEILGGQFGFRESIDSKALNNTDLTNVVALFNHDQNQILARTGVNLDLIVDDVGLKYRFIPPKTQLGNDLVENVRSGLITQSSFAFTLPLDDDAEVWEETDNPQYEYNRKILKIERIYDVSPVTFPAYPSTEVKIGARSQNAIDKLKAQKEVPKWAKEKRQLLKQMEIEDILKSIN